MAGAAMIEAGFVWLFLIGFEIVQTVRGGTTLSGFAWGFGKKARWLKWLGIGLIGLLALHLLWPLLKPEPVVADIACEEG